MSSKIYKLNFYCKWISLYLINPSKTKRNEKGPSPLCSFSLLVQSRGSSHLQLEVSARSLPPPPHHLTLSETIVAPSLSRFHLSLFMPWKNKRVVTSIISGLPLMAPSTSTVATVSYTTLFAHHIVYNFSLASLFLSPLSLCNSPTLIIFNKLTKLYLFN